MGQKTCKACSTGYYRSSASAQRKCQQGYKCPGSCQRSACAAVRTLAYRFWLLLPSTVCVRIEGRYHLSCPLLIYDRAPTRTYRARLPAKLAQVPPSSPRAARLLAWAAALDTIEPLPVHNRPVPWATSARAHVRAPPALQAHIRYLRCGRTMRADSNRKSSVPCPALCLE